MSIGLGFKNVSILLTDENLIYDWLHICFRIVLFNQLKREKP